MRLYTDLAPWYPLLTSREEYIAEAEDLWARLCAAHGGAPETILELGSGAGHLLSYLADRADVTFTDLNPDMLGLIAEHTHAARCVVGDMRHLRLGERFDAVVIHDAIDYMRSRDDLLAAFQTARAHADLVVVLPDHVEETFRESHGAGGTTGPDGRGLRFLEWSRRAPAGVVTDFVLCLLEPSGETRVVHDQHHFGLFPRATWTNTLREAGFARVESRPDPWRQDVFVGWLDGSAPATD